MTLKTNSFPTANFSKKLLAWYKKNARQLPWRGQRDPYAIWISEIMLQQTTVNAVISYYNRWMKRFPTVHHVAKAPLPKILKAWQGLGYYQRVRNLHKTAKIIVKEFGGQIPSSFEILRSLPGFGPYTAGAVASIAFQKPCPIIDANVRRVLMRQLGLRTFATPSIDKRLMDFLNRVIPQKFPGDFNQALMELGAEICRKSAVLCNVCPVKETCQAYKQNIQELIPKLQAKKIHHIRAAVGIIEQRNKYLIQKRPPKGLLAGLWEFPGGKIEKGESPQVALKRELKEELNIIPIYMKFLTCVKHFYTQFSVELFAYHCQLPKSPHHSHQFPSKNYRWATLSELKHKYPMPSGSAKIVDYLSHH